MQYQDIQGVNGTKASRDRNLWGEKEAIRFLKTNKTNTVRVRCVEEGGLLIVDRGLGICFQKESPANRSVGNCLHIKVGRCFGKTREKADPSPQHRQ
jgi:hypothetical protein